MAKKIYVVENKTLIHDSSDTSGPALDPFYEYYIQTDGGTVGPIPILYNDDLHRYYCSAELPVKYMEGDVEKIVYVSFDYSQDELESNGSYILNYNGQIFSILISIYYQDDTSFNAAMTNIANAIREKTGITSKLSLGGMIRVINSSKIQGSNNANSYDEADFDSCVSYFADCLRTKTNTSAKLNLKDMPKVLNDLVVLPSTDMNHWCSKNTRYRYVDGEWKTSTYSQLGKYSWLGECFNCSCDFYLPNDDTVENYPSCPCCGSYPLPDANDIWACEYCEYIYGTATINSMQSINCSKCGKSMNYTRCGDCGQWYDTYDDNHDCPAMRSCPGCWTVLGYDPTSSHTCTNCGYPNHDFECYNCGYTLYHYSSYNGRVCDNCGTGGQ
jgi:hypothetical protein